MNRAAVSCVSYRFDTSGVWSGGGQALLRNVEHAQQRHALLRGGGKEIPVIARNIPTKGSQPHGPYVIAPQNAWPWTPTFVGASELRRVVGLRLVGGLYLRRALGVMRLSSAVPATYRQASPVIHNVLDTGFEKTLQAATSIVPEAAGNFVSLGSIHSYRNLANLIAGYRRYREDGGKHRLWIAGAPGSQVAVRQVSRAAEGVDGLTITWSSVDRMVCVAAFRTAAAVVFPSRVEMSPVSVLEAAACTPNVVLSRIVGHQEILSEYAQPPDSAFFETESPGSIAAALARAELHAKQGSGELEACHTTLSDPILREQARVRWGDRVAEWLGTLDPSAAANI